MYGYTNKFSDIDMITDNPENYSTSDLYRTMNEARVVYENGNKSLAWYEQVKRICNSELKNRGEEPED